LVKCDKEVRFILIKGAKHQKEITIINLYAPNVSAPNFIKHTLKNLKAEGEFNTPQAIQTTNQQRNSRTK
jgi:hypothetical protein